MLRQAAPFIPYKATPIKTQAKILRPSALKYLLFFLISLFICQTAPLTADVGQNLKNAQKAYNEGDSIKALDDLWLATEEIWSTAPLAVRNVAFITALPKNFGAYELKAGEKFKADDPIIIYCEPIGFSQKKGSKGYEYSLSGAFEILAADGKLLGGQKNLGPYTQKNYQTFTTEAMLVMTIKAGGLPIGDYVLRLTLTDNFAPHKIVELDKPFTIVE